MNTLNKICRIGTILCGQRRASVYIHIKNELHYLSFTGVIGPLPSGNAQGGCGQIDMEFAHRNPADNDTRFLNGLIQVTDIKFAPGWTAEKWFDLLAYWKLWHLKEKIPQHVFKFIRALPDTDKHPAWV